MTFLTIQSLRKQYGTLAALDGVNLTIRRGSRTAIVGPSGSGKTTLLRMIAGFDEPDGGTIRLDGTVLAGPEGVMPAYRRGIGVVMQDGALFPHLTIAENIGFGLPRGEGRMREITALLDMVGLDPSMLGRKPDQISGGQQQRVAIARALATKPRLMLLDEPFSALDTGLRAATRNAVADLLTAQGVTTILVTHDQAEALSFADQLAVMRDGRLIQAGAPDALYLEPADRETAAFLGQAILLPAAIADGLARCGLGHLPVESGSYAGTTEIMLRPEQVTLFPCPDGEGESLAVVESVEFFGGWSDLTIRLKVGEGAAPQVVTLRQNGGAGWRPGMRVRALLSGKAHAFRPLA